MNGRKGTVRRRSPDGESSRESFVVEDSDLSEEEEEEEEEILSNNSKYRVVKNNIIEDSDDDYELPASRNSPTPTLDSAAGSSLDGRVTPSIEKAIRRSIHRIAYESEDEEPDDVSDSDEPLTTHQGPDDSMDDSNVQYLSEEEQSDDSIHKVESLRDQRSTDKFDVPRSAGKIRDKIKKSIRVAVEDTSSDDEIVNERSTNSIGVLESHKEQCIVVSDESEPDEDMSGNISDDTSGGLKEQRIVSDESELDEDMSGNITGNTSTNSVALSMAKEEMANTTLDPMAAQKRALLVCKQQQLEMQLAQTKKLFNVGAINALPDGGEKLRLSIASIEKELERVIQELRTTRMSKEVLGPPQGIKEVKPATMFKQDSLEINPDYLKPTNNNLNKELGKKAQDTLYREQSLTIERLQDLHGSLVARPAEDEKAKDPRGLKVPLMPHQQHALAWLLWREQQRPRGGVLADDMGLGKTLTMIALVMASIAKSVAGEGSDDEDHWKSSARTERHLGGTLVVAPASLVSQWEAEVNRRCNRGILTVELYHGNNRETVAKRLAKNDIVITSYNIVARAFKAMGVLYKIRWRRVILDEAHIIRNHKSQTCESVCGLHANTRWALTGTPIHNKEMDLYSILKFLQCSPFDDVRVWKRWVDNKNAAGHERLATVMKTLMLRRTKQELKESLPSLPDKSIEVINVVLDPEERLVYEKVMVYSRTLFAQFLAQRAEKAHMYELGAGNYDKPSWTVTHKDTQFTKAQNKLLSMHADVKSHEILVLLLRLRQVCCHPSLINSMLDQEDIEQVGAGEIGTDVDLLSHMDRMNIQDNGEEQEGDVGVDERVAEHLLTSDNPVFDSKRHSSKMRAVLEKVAEILEKGDKLIVVSQWTSVLYLLADELKSVNGASVSMFTGKVAVKDRQGIMDDFNSRHNKPNILLLSLTAGGVGLNLVGANHLLLIDIHWNPQLESQAQDRIYRFGQTKDVYIYKYICTDTIEERIKALQANKLELATAVLSGGGKVVGSKLTLDDIKSLFSL